MCSGKFSPKDASAFFAPRTVAVGHFLKDPHGGRCDAGGREGELGQPVAESSFVLLSKIFALCILHPFLTIQILTWMSCTKTDSLLLIQFHL